jgi:hypothetical protein
MKKLTPAQIEAIRAMLVTVEKMYARNEKVLEYMDRRERIPAELLQPIK